MQRHRYLIIGGGMAADAAVEGIRQVDADGSIGLIGAESHPPYDRPPLSKSLWKGRGLDTIWPRTRPMRPLSTSAARSKRSIPSEIASPTIRAVSTVREAAAGHRRHAPSSAPPTPPDPLLSHLERLPGPSRG